MKILKRILKEGKMVLKMESLDDLWHLYNIIANGDRVISRTSRRIRIGDEDSRKRESVRKVMTLVLEVEDVAFHSFSNRLRIKGIILEGPDDLVNIGSYHTFNVEQNDIITVIKEYWPKFLLKRIKKAVQDEKSPVCMIITIDDDEAELFLAADFGLQSVLSIRSGISRKRGDQKSHDATMREYFDDVTLAVRAQIEQNEIALIVSAGPGFVKEHFAKHLREAHIKDLPSIAVETTNSTKVTGAKEVLYRGVISETLTEIKLERETQLVENILTHVAKDDGLGIYGKDEVAKAVRFGAVEELLITDKKLREGSEKDRKWMDRLIRDTEKIRGEFHIVSTEHPAGDLLENLGGIAAVLRFRVEY
ncbi:MAG: mRNA surveillance protein pelota [Candidatus Lokiarchaeota archaeon]|nr:mRNA surveillance protein pelota [Candidatus Lokiarchaeota archaeon]